MRINNFGYLVKQGIKSVFVHGFMSFAAICVTVACLLLVGIFASVMYNLNLMVEDLNQTNEIVVYIDENLPEKDGFMVYANHQGMFDVVAIAATWERPLAAVMKKELENVPLLKQISLCTKSFTMDREDVRQSLEVIQNVIKEVQNGRNYLIFPEGTRSKNGNVMGEFHGGSFRCAVKAKAPILPITVIDCHRILDEKGSRPLTAQVHFLKPICYEEYKDLKTVDLAALVKSRIQETIDTYA